MATSLINTGIQFPDSSIQTTTHSIKSVQSIFANPKGTLTLTGDFGAYAVNVTISAVNTAKSFIFYPSVVDDINGYTFRTLSAKFINSTTVQLSCDNIQYFTPAYVRFQVVEFS